MGQMALPCQMQLVMESLVPSNGILRPRIQKREESGLKEDVSEDVKGEECSGSQLMKVLDDHPVYLETFMNTLSLILKGDGPLPFNYRRYLAIMASARHQSLVLVRSQMAAFSSVGGNQEWLCGLHAAPGKLCSISELNRILAHRPWILSSQHIQNLMKGSWSLSEVVHAIVIMLHFHALSSLVHGTGIEQHLISPSSADPNPLPPPPIGEEMKAAETDTSLKNQVEYLMDAMKRLQKEAAVAGEASPEERALIFESLEAGSAELLVREQLSWTKPMEDVDRFLDAPDFSYVDFSHRNEPQLYPTFRVQDYSWEEQGFSLMSRLYSEKASGLMDLKLKTAYDLTYYTMGNKKNVDTTMFRRAVWHYIHCLYGIRHDDYDYHEVNQLLERSLKSFIKMACCFPERLTSHDLTQVMPGFLYSEKIHVMLMVMEARIEAGLLYALRAIMQYMT